MIKQRYIPLAVRRQLRQEAHFGCAKCGIPILEYHHIIPWAEEQHNRPEDMIALCGTCHQIVGKLSRQIAYDLKDSPFNQNTGKIRGLLGTDRVLPSFVMGTNTFINTPIIFGYFGVPIFRYEIRDGQSLISAFLPKTDFWPEVEIVENDLIIKTGALWDVEFKTNTLVIKRRKGENFLSIDLRGEHALVAANLSIGRHQFDFNDKSTNFGGSGRQITGGTFENCGAGLAFEGNKERIIRPTYAMNAPQAVLLRHGTVAGYF